MEGAEFGGPPWTFGQRTFEFLPEGTPGERAGRILCSYSSADSAGKTLAVLDPSTGQLERVDTGGFSSFGSLAVGEDGAVALVGGSSRAPPAVAALGNLEGANGAGAWSVLKRSR